MIQRTTIIYVCILAGFGLLLWGVLRFGSTYLRAPNELAGAWTLRSTGGGAAQVKHVKLEQSGRYFRAYLDDKPLSLRLDTTRSAADTGAMILISKTSEWRFTPVTKDEFAIDASGPLAGHWQATRETPGQSNAR